MKSGWPTYMFTSHLHSLTTSLISNKVSTLLFSPLLSFSASLLFPNNWITCLIKVHIVDNGKLAVEEVERNDSAYVPCGAVRCRAGTRSSSGSRSEVWLPNQSFELLYKPSVYVLPNHKKRREEKIREEKKRLRRAWGEVGDRRGEKLIV